MSNLHKLLITFLFFISCCLPASMVSAAVTPKSGAHDSRMRTVEYNPNDVTLIHAHYGFTTHIQFGAGEIITDVAMGDPTAWACEVRQNHIFLKPSSPEASTNMAVLTSKYVYAFDLKAYAPSSGTAQFYQVSFRYPAEEQAKAEQEEYARLMREKLELGSEPFGVNWNYYKVGHESISPTEVFDDDVFTYLRFPANRDFPAVYRQYPDGSEALLNSHVNGNAIVVHSIEQRILLRRGNQAALIFNGSFNPDGIELESGMTVRGFTRTVKGEH